MNSKKVMLGCMIRIEYECLEGYEITQEQLAWITELYMTEFLNTPLKERLRCNICEEENFAWAVNDVKEKEPPKWFEELIMKEEIDSYFESEEK